MLNDNDVTIRRDQRNNGIRLRESIGEHDRRDWDHRIESHLEDGIVPPGGCVVGFCWPFRAEFDARPLIMRWRRTDARLVLPAVIGKGQPLSFREWYPDAPMAPEVYGIPVPQGTSVLVPDVLLVPLNAFDAKGYRLGYGGGFFDRTLAAIRPKPIAIGIAYELLRLETINPQAHDIPMDFVVTQAGIHAVVEGALRSVTPEMSRRLVNSLSSSRGLPRMQA